MIAELDLATLPGLEKGRTVFLKNTAQIAVVSVLVGTCEFLFVRDTRLHLSLMNLIQETGFVFSCMAFNHFVSIFIY